MSGVAFMGDAEKLRAIVDDLVGEAIIDEADADDAHGVLLSLSVQWGYMTREQAAKFRNNSAVSVAEQKRIVDIYAEHSKTAATNQSLCRKIRELGVSPESITRWARKIYGPGYLRRVRPPSALYLIREYLRADPWHTRAEIVGAVGVPRTSISGALHWGMRKGTLTRRMGAKGLYEWATV